MNIISEGIPYISTPWFGAAPSSIFYVGTFAYGCLFYGEIPVLSDNCLTWTRFLFRVPLLLRLDMKRLNRSSANAPGQ